MSYDGETRAICDGETGKIFEWCLLGSCKATIGYQEAQYLDFKKSLEWVKNNQKSDPTGKPEKAFAQAIKRGIAKKLGVLYHEVRYYSAIGSALDIFHGIDAFVEYGGKIVTIDVTKESHKTYRKANILITKDIYEAGVDSGWSELVTDIANRLRA